MLVQISAGQGKGVKECEYACCLLYKDLLKEFSSLEVVSTHYKNKECLKSAIFYTEEDLSFLEGTVQWICQSPFRPHHKRKNWFIDVSVIKKDIKIGNTDEMTAKEIRALLQEGLDDINAGKVQDASEAFAKFKESL